MAVDLRDLKGCRILMAEDNEINMEIACEIIGSWGAVIHKVYNGRQAVDKFKEMPENYYDMILMDIQIPEMNGTVPMIAMTANAFSDDIVQSLSCGMNAHVTKPVDFEALRGILLEYVRSGPMNR